MTVNQRRLPGQPGNFAGSGSLGFAVGDPAWLSSQESKVARYWRTIEQGTEGFVGHALGGLWTSAYSSHDQRGALITGGILDKFGPPGQKFVPFFSQMRTSGDARAAALRALRYLVATGQITGRAFAFFRTRLLEGNLETPTAGIVRREIVGQHAYRQAFQVLDLPKAEREEIARAIKAVYRDYGNRPHAVLDERRQRPAPITSTALRQRTGFLTARALRGYNYSVVSFDAVFQSNLTAANRALALRVAEEVARIQREDTHRKDVSTGALEEATLDPRNRFPS